jgi:predicted DNA-binding WGR domain protein
MTKSEIISRVFEQGEPKLIYKDKKIIKEILDLILEYDWAIVNTEEGHYKFWTFTGKHGAVTYTWGKIGGTPQSAEKNDGLWEAMVKRRRKIEKGYVRIGWNDAK